MTTACAFLISSLLLGSCGGGSVASIILAGIGGTGIVFGPITGFGSVYVNGNRFEIDTSEFDVDGNTGADQTNLRLGMVVRLEVETENGVYTGKALKVIYDDEIEGPLTNVQPDLGDPAIKTGFIFGKKITFNETTTIFENTSFDALGEESNPASEDVVEISGFRSATGIVATYVRFIDDLNLGITKVELRGNISNLMGSAPNQTFKIGGIDIATNGSTVTDVPGGVLVVPLFVEVKGVIQSLTSILATRIEEEDEDFDEEVDDISLQGVVSNFSDIGNFFIGSQQVNAIGARFSPAGLEFMDLTDMNIEVEGEIVGGTLFADEVESREGDIKLRSTIGQVDTVNYEWFEVTYPTPTPGVVVVNIDAQTVFEDETGAVPSETFSISDLNANVDFVRVEGREVNGEVIAGVVKRTSTSSSLRLEGRVQNYLA
ncbi:MAG: DUF5666 domain-containing protein, partial [Gammaproteobacteria bacterium]|nr:DUF5666 domain-containing protein [Gammaproteobacteria bacterium]